MSESIAGLGFSVDASSLQAGAQGLAQLSDSARTFARSLDQLAAAGEPMDRVLADLQKSGALTGQSFDQLSARYAANAQAAQASASQINQAFAGIKVPDLAAAGGSSRAVEQAGAQWTVYARAAQQATQASQQTVQAVQQSARATTQAGEAAEQTATRVRGLAAATQQVGGSGAGIGRLSGDLRNASYQITDFIVQVSNGTDVARAAGQQLPQLLAGFGTVGVVAGLAAAGIAALVPVIETWIGASGNAAQAVQETTKSTDGLLKSLDATREGAGSLAASMTGLTASQKSVVGGSLTAELHAQQAAFAETSKAAEDYVKGLGQGARTSTFFSSMLGQGEFSTGPSEEDAQRFKAVTAAAQDLQTKMAALQAGAGSFDTVAEAVRALGASVQDTGKASGDAAVQWDQVTAAQATAARAAAEQRVAVEAQVDGMAPLAAANEAARQSLLLHTAQVHEFLAAMGNTKALTDFDQKILDQAEVAKKATEAIKELNSAHQLAVASEVADRIRASGAADAGKQADDYLTRAAAQGPAQDFQRNQETKQAVATIEFKGDTTQANQALDLLKKAGKDAGETFEQTAQHLASLGKDLGLPYAVVQKAVAEARLEADKLIVSQRQAAEVQKLVEAGFSPAAAQQQVAAIQAGNQGLNERAKAAKDLADAKKAESALDAAGPAFEKDRAAAAQNVLQLTGKLADIDKKRADEAGRQAEATARAREALLGQADAESRLASDEENLARARRTAPGAKGPVLRNQEEADQAQAGASKRYFSALEEEAAKRVAGASEVQKVEQQISAVQEGMARHVETRAVGERELTRLTGERGRLLDKENEAIQKAVEGDEKRLGVLRAQNQRARTGGGEIAARIQGAGEQAEAQFPDLPYEQQKANPGAQVQRAARREEAGELARDTEELKARKEAVLALGDPQDRLVEQQARLNEVLRAGYITQDQYTAALRRRTVEADRAARQQRISDLTNTGEPGSGVGIAGQVGAGAQAAGLQFVEQYGNAAQQTTSALNEMGNQGVDALLALANGAQVNAAQVVGSMAMIVEKMLLTIAIARVLQAALGGTTPGAGSGVTNQASEAAFAAGSSGAAYGFHSGGEVTAGGNGSQPRYFPQSAIDRAPRYHSGSGTLQPDERLSVLQTGERVLDRQENRAYGSTPVINMPVTINNQAGAKVSTRQDRGPDGQPRLQVMLEKANDASIRGGRHDGAMASRYGLGRALV